MKIEADALKARIVDLLVTCPELSDDETMRLDMLEGETDIKELLSRIVRMIGATKSDMGALTSYAAELLDRRNRFERRAEALRTLAFSIMQTADLPKIVLPEATLNIQRGSPRVIVTDETKLTDDFVKIVRQPDKAAIKMELANGGTVDGAELSNATPFLVIRTS